MKNNTPQKTVTINGRRYTGAQIARAVCKARDNGNITNGNDYIIELNGNKYFASYRQVQDIFWAPTCSADEANAIALMPDNGTWNWSIWVSI